MSDQATSPGAPEAIPIRVNDLADLVFEKNRLERKVNELQTEGTRMAGERQAIHFLVLELEWSGPHGHCPVCQSIPALGHGEICGMGDIVQFFEMRRR